MAQQTYAGAMLEVLVNANIGRLPKQHAWIEILIAEDASVEQARPWDAPDQRARAFGDQWYLEQRSTVLKMLRASKPKPVVWDERLFR